MNFFYLKHHYLSIVRSKSFGGETFAFVLLIILMGSSAPILYGEFETYASSLGAYLGFEERRDALFVFLYFVLDMVVRIIFKRPSPQAKYYLLWTNKIKSISWQYLVTSFFGLLPFMLLIPQLTLVVKVNEWLGLEKSLAILGLFFFNHYFGLFLQFSRKKTKTILLLTLASMIVLTLYQLVNLDIVLDMFLSVKIVLPLTVSAIVGAFYSVNYRLKERKLYQGRSSFSLLRFLPSVNFKNPLFQLEWSLIVRNKRTRSNLLMGMLSVLLLPFLMDDKSPDVLILALFLMGTSFFIIQHGVYSLGWEGSYFDFLLTNATLNNLLKTGICSMRGLVF